MDAGLERTIVTVLLGLAAFALVYLSSYNTSVIAFVGPLVGAISAYWFRLNGQSPKSGV